MKWSDNVLEQFKWCGEITHYEEKLEIAKRLAGNAKDGDVIGFGSGSTSFLVLCELSRRVKEEGLRIKAITTSYEIEMACRQYGIETTTLNNDAPDWAYDGADEVDADHSLIKGRGGAMFREKLVMSASPKTFIVADKSKMVSRLCEKFPIPVEVHPLALTIARKGLIDLGATELQLRLAQRKDGPVITESGNIIVDVRFDAVDRDMEKRIKGLPGVIESGLFIGYSIEIVC